MIEPRCVNRAFWAGRRVLLTGHTGFKGAWASLWLARMGAQVTGLALAPEASPNLFKLAAVERDIVSIIGDIRDPGAVQAAVKQAKPEIVLHAAAQPLVRRSFADPVETYGTNVMGTVHLLEALRQLEGLEAILVVTTDKVYANDESGRAFVESDRLGGHDPYAASKAATELATASYRESFFDATGVRVATARGGNVIGGGDFSRDRIVPDIWRALEASTTLQLRNPEATRPWQHILDCLSGYLLHIESLVQDPRTPYALNFGPDPTNPVSVATLVETMQRELHLSRKWSLDCAHNPREMQALSIDASKARQILGWRDRLPGNAAIEATAGWYKALKSGADMPAFTRRQIEEFVEQ